jgi:hypothetical protein
MYFVSCFVLVRQVSADISFDTILLLNIIIMHAAASHERKLVTYEYLRLKFFLAHVVWLSEKPQWQPSCCFSNFKVGPIRQPPATYSMATNLAE